MSEAQVKVQISSLLDTSFDDIQSLPDFVVPVPGTYSVKVAKAGLEQPDEGEPYIGFVYHMVSALEPDAAVAMNYPEGAPFSERYYGNIGAGNMKKVFAQVREQLGANSIGELLDKIVDTELVVTITNRKDREDKTKIYCNVKMAVCS